MNSNSDSEVLTMTRAIGERLRAARQARGLSLSQLAALTDGALSKSRISNYEQGLRRLPVEVARILAATLGTISAVELLLLENDCPDMKADEIQLLKLLRSATPETRERILEAAMLASGQSADQSADQSTEQNADKRSDQSAAQSSEQIVDQSSSTGSGQSPNQSPDQPQPESPDRPVAPSPTQSSSESPPDGSSDQSAK